MSDHRPQGRPAGRRTIQDLFGMMAMDMRRQVAADLLRGNDTCCFTADQYRARYALESAKLFALPPSEVSAECALMQLRSIPETVEEVRPGVWAAKGADPS